MKKLLLVLFTLLMSVGSAWAAVNANTASIDELQTVTGIGPTIAQRIVDERKKGPFKDLADLEQRVKGIGESSVKKMAAAGLTVGGSSRSQSKSGDAEPRKATNESGKGTEAAAGKGSSKASTGSSDKAAAPAAAKATAPASDKVTAAAADKPAAKTAGKPPADKTTDKTTDKGADKTTDKSTGKAVAKP